MRTYIPSLTTKIIFIAYIASITDGLVKPFTNNIYLHNFLSSNIP